MKTNLWKLATLALLPAGMLATASCQREKVAEQVTTVSTPDGAIEVDTFTATATVTAIDAANRKVTLVTPEGHKATYKAGPDVANFGQIQVGDQVKAVLTEEVAVAVGSGAAPSGTSGEGVVLAPVGAKPGGVRVDTSQITAKVTGVDAAKHKITFELPDGTTKTVKAGKQVDVSVLHPGDNVTVQVSEGLAITVEKP